MSCKSFSQQRSSFTPYQQGSAQKQLSLFSRLNLNDMKDKISLNHQYIDHDQSDLFSMRSKKRRGSVQIQLKQSMIGNRTYLNNSLIGKSSLQHNHQNDIFGHYHEHYQDLGIGLQYDHQDQKKQRSQKSCPIVGPMYNNQQNEQSQAQIMQFNRIKQAQQTKPRFHKTKNLLRTISNYLHKYLLHNKRSQKFQQKYFLKVLCYEYNLNYEQNKLNMLLNNQQKNKLLDEENQKMQKQIQAFSKIKIQEQKQQDSKQKQQKQKQHSKSRRNSSHSISIKSTTSKNKIIKKSRQKSKQTKKQSQQLSSKQTKQEIKTTKKSKDLLQQINKRVSLFHEWISTLSIINFADYQKIWTEQHEYLPLYRQMCYKYYKQEVYCDVMRSRLTTKQITNKFLFQFVQGLFNPKQFYRFR